LFTYYINLLKKTFEIVFKLFFLKVYNKSYTMPLPTTNLSLSNVKNELNSKITPTNWYTNMQYINQYTSFTPVISGTDPLVQMLIQNGSGQQGTLYQQFRIQDYSFRFTFQVNTVGFGVSGDSIKVFFGYRFLEPYEIGYNVSTGNTSTNYDNANGFSLNIWTYSNGSIPNISLVDNNQVVRGTYYSSLFNAPSVSTWNTFSILYQRSPTNQTWVVNLNGTPIITYTDANNAIWTTKLSGDFWGIQCRGGGDGMTNYLRGLQVDYIGTNSTSILSTPSNSTNNMLFNRYNWQSYFSPYGTIGSGSTNIISTVANTSLYTYQISSNGQTATDLGIYANNPIHTYSSFTLNCRIGYSSTGNTGDSLGFYFGASASGGYLLSPTQFATNGGWSVVLISWGAWPGNNGYSGQGIFLFNTSGNIVAGYNTSAFINTGTGVQQQLTIIYNRSTLNTWTVLFNGIEAFTYNDSSNATFAANGNSYFGITKHNGGYTESVYIGYLELDYIPYSISFSQLYDSGKLASALTNITIGNSISASYLAGNNKQFADGLSCNLIYYTSSLSTGPGYWWYGQIPNSNTSYTLGRFTNFTNLGLATGYQQPVNTYTNYTLEYYGYFRAPVTGSYTFYMWADDGVYLWIGNYAQSGWSLTNHLLYVNYTQSNPQSATISLTAGVYYPMRLLYTQTVGNTDLQLSFTLPGSSTKIYDGTGYYFSALGTTPLYSQIGLKVDITSLAFWLDMQNPSSYTLSGSNVTAYSDLSGQGRNLTNYNGTVYPTYNASLINNKPGLNMSNTSALTYASGFSTSTNGASSGMNVTFVAVFTVTSGIPNWGCLISHGNRDNDFCFRRQNGNSYFCFQTGGTGYNNLMTLTYTNGNTYIVIGTISAATAVNCNMHNPLNTTLNGTATTGNSWSSGNKVLYVGVSDASEYFQGYLGEMMYFQRVLTSYEQNVLLTSLKAKWGFPTQQTPQNGIQNTNLLGPLDRVNSSTKSSCTGAYAMTLLTKGYTGPIVNLRRSSDNAVVDFYADTYGNIGQSSNGSGTSLASWLTTNTAYVVKWYDQSGNGNHATTSSNAMQPVLTLIGGYTYVVDSQNSSSQYMLIPSGTIPVGVLNAPYSFIVKHGSVNGVSGTGAFLSGGVNGTINIANTLEVYPGNTYLNWWFSNDIQFGTYNPGNQVCVTFDGLVRKGYINGKITNSYTNTGNMVSSGQQYLFTDLQSHYLNGQMYNCMIFNKAIPVTDLAILTSNNQQSYPTNNNY
jgi:hypothetical protein